jgi:hypothetical protein
MLAVVMGSVSGLVNDAMAIPYDGPSVSISESEFSYDGSTKKFGTVGDNTVVAFFLDQDGNDIQSFGLVPPLAYLEITPVNFSGLSGFDYGTGGGFRIYDVGGDILIGSFADGSVLIADANNAKFVSSVIISFDKYAGFNPPGLFSATLGDIGILDINTSFTTGGDATATIESSAVPEPTTLLLLGSGLAGLGILGRLRKNINNRKKKY